MVIVDAVNTRSGPGLQWFSASRRTRNSVHLDSPGAVVFRPETPSKDKAGMAGLGLGLSGDSQVWTGEYLRFWTARAGPVTAWRAADS